MTMLRYKDPVTGNWEPLIGTGPAGPPGPSGLPPGGTTGQALVKASDADGDVSWADVTTIVSKFEAEIERLNDRITKLEAS